MTSEKNQMGEKQKKKEGTRRIQVYVCIVISKHAGQKDLIPL